MEAKKYAIVLRDVSLIDVEEFKAGVQQDEMRVIQPGKGNESHNELATILVLTLAPPALTALTVWLLRDTENELVEYHATIRRPDGTEIVVHLKIKKSSSQAPEAQVVKQIAEALKVPEIDITSATVV